jgi:hypothetical protein
MNAAKLIPLSVAFGLWAVSIKAAPLSPEEAAAYIGETATVCSVVVSIKFVTISLSRGLGAPFAISVPDRPVCASLAGLKSAPFGA